MAEENKLPVHVAVIMDGNGRWAKKRGLPRVSGHTEGMNTLTEIVKRSSVLGIKYLTVYAFSTENWKRPAEEVSGIFNLLVRFTDLKLKELNDNNVKVNMIGAWEVIPKDAKKAVDTLIDTTKNNTGLVFNIAINYGGRAEILRASERLLCMQKEGTLNEPVSEELFSSLLYTGGMPDPDLLIRTGGDNRISNFLLWQISYAEIAVLDCCWPDLTADMYEQTLIQFGRRERRFGGIK